MRPEGPKIEAEGRERVGILGELAASPPDRAGSGSDVNNTKFLKSRPKNQDTDKKTTYSDWGCFAEPSAAV